MISVLIQMLATGKVAAMSVTDLFKASDVVVTAKVASVDNIVGTKVASANVIQVYKGSVKQSKVSFLAEPTWTCDVSGAKPGERVLLYLVCPDMQYVKKVAPKIESAISLLSGKGEELYFIGDAGRGRISTIVENNQYGLAAEFRYDRWVVNFDLYLPDKKYLKSKKEKGFISVQDIVKYR